MQKNQHLSDETSSPVSGRWILLVAVSVAQFVVVLTATVVSVALPFMQDDLLLSDADRGWVVTAYAVTFAGCLLVGGRLVDRIGAKTAFLSGMGGFVVTSVLVSVAVEPVLALSARAGQGAFSAILVPSALSILSREFRTPRDRARAFGVFSVVATAGGASGLVIGGAITQYLGWRWCFLVAIPVAVIATVLVALLFPRVSHDRTVRVGVVQAATVTLGCAATIFGLAEIQSAGLWSPLVLVPAVCGTALIVVFVLVQRRTSSPLVPGGLVRGIRRIAALCAIAVASGAMMGGTLLLGYYLQDVAGMSAGQAGAAMLGLPLSIVVVNLAVVAPLLARFDAFVLLVPAIVAVALAGLLLTMLTPSTPYWTHLLPAIVLLGVGLGTAGTASLTVILDGVDRSEAGIASAVQQASQQVGGALGIAGFNAIATAVTAAAVAADGAGPGAVVVGFAAASWTTVVGAALALPLSAIALAGAMQRGAVRLKPSPLPGDVPVDPPSVTGLTAPATAAIVERPIAGDRSRE